MKVKHVDDQKEYSITLPASGGVIGVISDTHSMPHKQTEQYLRIHRPTAILHAGDIGDVSCLSAFQALAPTFAVRGNIDAKGQDLPEQIVFNVSLAGQSTLRIWMTHIALRRSRLLNIVAESAKRVNAQMVVCGHSHVPFIGRDKGLTVFNPGSIGPRRFSLPIIFGLIEYGPNGVRLRHICCETGQTWHPA